MTKDEALAFLETLESSDEIKDPLAVLESLRKTREEAKTYREQLADVQTKLETLESAKQTNKTRALVAELRGRGIKNPERIIKVLDSEKIDYTDDGNLRGFDEAYELASTEWPELFDSKRRAGKIDQFSDKAPEVKLSTTQQQLRRLHEAHAS